MSLWFSKGKHSNYQKCDRFVKGIQKLLENGLKSVFVHIMYPMPSTEPGTY